MNAAYELALLLKNRDNAPGYSPVCGVIEALPDIKIRLSEKIVLDESDIDSLVDLRQKNSGGNYIYLKKSVYILPISSGSKKFLVIGAGTL